MLKLHLLFYFFLSLQNIIEEAPGGDKIIDWFSSYFQAGLADYALSESVYRRVCIIRK